MKCFIQGEYRVKADKIVKCWLFDNACWKVSLLIVP
jgi:hypothetical protein